MLRLTEKEIETAYQTIFQFDEVYENNILVEESYYQCEIENLLALKSSFSNRLSKLQLTTKSPDSDNIRVIRSLARKIMELEESTAVVNTQLNEMRLTKTELEAHLRSSVSIVNQHVENEEGEDGLFLGFLAYVLMME